VTCRDLTWVTRAALGLAVAATLLAGCTDDPVAPAEQPDVTAPAKVPAAPASSFSAQRTKAPPGFHVEQCPDLRSHDNSGLAVRLIVPDSYPIEVSWDRTGCSFTADLARHLYLDFGPLETLASYTEWAVRLFEGDEGDDSISDVRFVDDVPVFGRTKGGQLDYRPYNDGLPLETRILQAHGLRLQWDVKDARPACGWAYLGARAHAQRLPGQGRHLPGGCGRQRRRPGHVERRGQGLASRSSDVSAAPRLGARPVTEAVGHSWTAFAIATHLVR
jgi:hypothetical protein